MKKVVYVLVLNLLLINIQAQNNMSDMADKSNMDETAVFGAGCFWCVEAVFQQLKGIIKVDPGYAGGTVKNPSYKEVCTGRTGHAEVARIIYNPDEISYETLLTVFFKSHDPTTLNYQGNDHGTQYRSTIFYTSDEQKLLAEKMIKKLTDEHAFSKPIVTEVTKLDVFYEAEDYHHEYFKNNPDQGYCRYVIQPKVEKVKHNFKDLLK